MVTSLQVLHALLEFYPNQRAFRILLHDSLSFLLLLRKLFSQCFRASTRQDGCGFYRCSYFAIGRLGWIGFAFQQVLETQVEWLRQCIPAEPAYLRLFIGGLEFWLSRGY